MVLIGGDPGIGKSTILLQTLVYLSKSVSVLYVTGEESLQQVAMRANRLQLDAPNLPLMAETHVETILAKANQEKPKVIVIDSIQTIFTDSVQSAPGSVSQVREATQQLVKYAKSTGTAIFLVGHVTKEGALAGPRVLEHMVDTVLYFEAETDSRFRLIRAIKNRFGAVNELGLFAMTEVGLKEVQNPSAIFLSKQTEPMPGSCIMVTWEGSRPLLVEVQSLVDTSFGGVPKRVSVGIDSYRLSILLAVLNRHAHVSMHQHDVFLNIVGGVKVAETASDLAILSAMLSSFKNQLMDKDTVIFGEVGLAGEVRPVQFGEARLKEAEKHGFKRAIIPYSNRPKTTMGLEIIPIKHLQTLVDVLRGEYVE
jgi:DNA repair protein RadA/Sms